MSFNSNNTFITRGAEIAYPPGSPEIPPVIFSRTFVAHSLIFCVVLCQPLFISFYPFLAIALFVFFSHFIVCPRVYDFRLSFCYLHFSYYVLKCLKRNNICFLILCTFSVEIKESIMSDTRCCITTLWWLKNDAAFHEIFELLCHDVISFTCGGNASM